VRCAAFGPKHLNLRQPRTSHAAPPTMLPAATSGVGPETAEAVLRVHPTPRSLYEAWLRASGRHAPSGGFQCRQASAPAASPLRLLEGIEARAASHAHELAALRHRHCSVASCTRLTTHSSGARMVAWSDAVLGYAAGVCGRHEDLAGAEPEDHRGPVRLVIMCSSVALSQVSAVDFSNFSCRVCTGLIAEAPGARHDRLL
jgi:hypothetical protein